MWSLLLRFSALELASCHGLFWLWTAGVPVRQKEPSPVWMLEDLRLAMRRTLTEPFIFHFSGLQQLLVKDTLVDSSA
jgi:hypothetical protein